MKPLIAFVSCVAVIVLTVPARAQKEEVAISTTSEEALALYKQGLSLSERARAQEAVSYFEKAIAKDRTFAMAYLGLANVQTSPKGFFDNLRKAVSRIDKVSDGERLTILAAQAIADNNTVKSKEYLDTLVQAYPKDKRAHLALGTYYWGQQEYSMAISELEKATRIDAAYPPAFNLLGYAYTRSGEYQAAEKAFKKYTELIPDESNPHDSYAELLMKMGKFEESIQEYQKSIAINPKFYGSYLGLGIDYVLKGMHYEAIKVFRRLFDIAPDDGTQQQALYAQVMCFVDQRQFARAVAEEQRNYEISRENNDVPAMVADLGTLGDLLIEIGPIDQARARFEKAKEITLSKDVPKGVKEFADQVTLSGIVRVALHKSDIASAKAVLKKFKAAAGKSRNPSFMLAYNQHAAMVALDEKKYNESLQLLQKADQRSPRTLLLIGQAYQASGNNAKAKEFYGKAANFNEINMEFMYVRSKAKQMLAKM